MMVHFLNYFTLELLNRENKMKIKCKDIAQTFFMTLTFPSFSHHLVFV